MTDAPVADPGVPPSQRGGTPARLLPVGWDAALQSLEFDEVLAVLASFASGPLGAEAVRALRPSDDPDAIEPQLARAAEVLALLRRGGTFAVAAVSDVRGALGRLRLDGGVVELAELASVRRTLIAGAAVATELDRRADACPRLAELRVPPVDRSVLRMLDLAVSDDGELLDTASPALAAARRAVHVARERLLRRLESMLRDADASAIPAGANVTVREGRYVIPVRRDSRQRPEGIVHDESASAGTLFIEPTAAIALGNALRSAIVTEERETLIVLRELSQRLRPHGDALAALHEMAVAVDSIVARGRMAAAFDAEVPRLGRAGGPLRLANARHPLLLARGVPAVPFDLDLPVPERTVLISGPNTGGKTVLLKTVGLAVAMTQAGIIPPVGPESVVPVMRALFVDIGDHQSLNADLSTFSAHVAALRAILDAADSTTLVLLDEIGSGTDPAEGGALASAALEALTTRGALTLATTHLGALKSLASEMPGVVNGSLQFDGATLSPTYRFTKGIPGRSYGIAIARRLGVDAGVLARAETLVPEADRELDRLLATVEARRHAVELRDAELAGLAADLERREHVVAITAEAQQAREHALRDAEKTAVRDRARQAKAYLLEARKQVEAALAQARGAVDEVAAREARRLVEEGVREQANLLDEPEPAAPASSGALHVGARVRLNTGATGDVGELRGDGKVVVHVGIMRLVVHAASLTVLPATTRLPPRTPVVGVDEPAREAAAEIDLRGMRADEAHAAVRAAIDQSMLADQPRLAIIHGMGTGVLRDVVRQLLAGDARVASFDFAPRQQGGVGVTVAVLR